MSKLKHVLHKFAHIAVVIALVFKSEAEKFQDQGQGTKSIKG